MFLVDFRRKKERPTDRPYFGLFSYNAHLDLPTVLEFHPYIAFFVDNHALHGASPEGLVKGG